VCLQRSMFPAKTSQKGNLEESLTVSKKVRWKSPTEPSYKLVAPRDFPN
jgi:hypothetical protein